MGQFVKRRADDWWLIQTRKCDEAHFRLGKPRVQLVNIKLTSDLQHRLHFSPCAWSFPLTSPHLSLLFPACKIRGLVETSAGWRDILQMPRENFMSLRSAVLVRMCLSLRSHKCGESIPFSRKTFWKQHCLLFTCLLIFFFRSDTFTECVGSLGLCAPAHQRLLRCRSCRCVTFLLRQMRLEM